MSEIVVSDQSEKTKVKKMARMIISNVKRKDEIAFNDKQKNGYYGYFRVSDDRKCPNKDTSNSP